MTEHTLNSILLIDDDPDILEFNELLIDQVNISKKIFQAKNGSEALELFNNFLNNNLKDVPDLIILDINMPKMNGLEFLRLFDKVSKTSELYHVKILISSSIEDEEIRKEYQSYRNVIGTTYKPLSKKILTEMLNENFNNLLSYNSI
jgi:CheY-like chemotaxis protein